MPNNINHNGFRLLAVFLTIWSFCSCGGNPAFDDIIEEGDRYVPPTTNSDDASSEMIPTDALIIAQWNIGHFSYGISPNSKITGSSFERYRNENVKVISYTNADIFCVNEYSEFFGTDENGEKQKADEILFSTYFYSTIGHQSRYSCNAIFSSLPLINAQEQIFECNQTAVITHTSAIKATDYYFIESIIQYKGYDIKLVTTHLAFDNNNPEVAINQIRELIERYEDEEHVILCGDWNTGRSSFDLFAEAGYQLGNHGKFGDFITFDPSKYCLDNIIVKGLEIIDFKAINSNLSDHKPIIAALVLPE